MRIRILILSFLLTKGCLSFGQDDSSRILLITKGFWKCPIDNKVIYDTNKGETSSKWISFIGDSTYDIHSVCDGEVVHVSEYDSVFMIVVKQGSYFIGYSNLSKAIVKKHDRIKAGQTIANMGLDFDNRYRLDMQMSDWNTDIDIVPWFTKETCRNFQ